MAEKLQGDDLLIVTFFPREITKSVPRVEDWVKVVNPTDPRSELIQRATSLSHMDPETGEGVTYAERFSEHFAAYKNKKGEKTAERIDELKAQLAALENETRALPNVTKAEVKQALADIDDPATVADGPKFEAMTDDEIRDWIAEQTGKEVPGTVSKRETLERMAREVVEG